MAEDKTSQDAQQAQQSQDAPESSAQDTPTGNDRGTEQQKFRIDPESGGIQIRTEHQTGPEASGPEAGQPDRDSHAGRQGESGTQDATGKQEQGGQPAPTEDAAGGQGQQFADLPEDQQVEQYNNLLNLYGRLTNEVGELRKAVENKEKTPEELYDEMDSRQLTQALADTEAELEELEASDDVDQDEVKEKRMLKHKLEADIVSKRAEEAVNQRLSSQENEEFKRDIREHYQDQGIPLSDEQFEQATELAEQYAQDGRLTEGAYYKAMIDLHGLDKMRKVDQMNGEQKARQEIQQAEQKSSEQVSPQGSGRDTGWKPLGGEGKTIAQIEQELNQLDPETVHQMRQEVDKQAGV